VRAVVRGSGQVPGGPRAGSRHPSPLLFTLPSRRVVLAVECGSGQGSSEPRAGASTIARWAADSGPEAVGLGPGARVDIIQVSEQPVLISVVPFLLEGWCWRSYAAQAKGRASRGPEPAQSPEAGSRLVGGRMRLRPRVERAAGRSRHSLERRKIGVRSGPGPAGRGDEVYRRVHSGRGRS